jgi:hypothetical protein
MKVLLTTVALGGWYPRGAARLIQKMGEISPGYDVHAFINTLPAGAPADVIEKGYDYTGYCAKPFALLETKTAGADIGILLDAAFYPIRAIEPLVEHIARNGYYFCRNGFKIGEWASDRCLERMGLSRERAWDLDEISSYCVGLNFHDKRCGSLLKYWCNYAADGVSFPGPHTAIGHEGRNKGFVSTDPRVKGHRHDQTVLSILAHWAGMTDMVDRPRFTAYKAGYGGFPDDTTVFENEGM